MLKKISILVLLATFTLILWSQPGLSQQVRNFPVDSKLGDLTAVSFPVFTINGQQFQMAAGGQVRGIDNLIIQPSTASYKGLIRYQLDISGYLHRVWFLTPDEVKAAEREGQRVPSLLRRLFSF
ncbi:hypothetical protein [Nitrosomonas sp. JL21]|uniref:hypothetical protein n=1 Tax=Nitrosomonas sp. JL21 TaxID=153949 RepID=UPI001F03FA1F|nr:hypothetical protein [Nitrosomonas sp. JL21]